ncbi:MAG: prepilin-type N-terminal cleavage/methylation domain-containing protein [Christensenellales bacterium]
MKKNNKKGFTIVELVIVIAVIAILAAVLIPTFSSIIKKAKVNNDIQLVRNLNTALATDTKEHKTMQSALDAAFEFGYDVAKINNTSVDENKILWDSVNDVFCYLKDGALEYVPNSATTVLAVNDYRLWTISDTVDGTYSTYLYNYEVTETSKKISALKGLDVGKTEGITEIEYVNDTAQEVVIRTNGGTLKINAPSGIVKHYGDSLGVNIIEIAPASYHEHGTVLGNIEIAKGRIEVANGAKVGTILVSSAATGDVKVDVVSGAEIGTVAPTTESAKQDINASSTIPAESKQEEVVNTEVTSLFAGGLGTEASPYLIANVEHFQNIISGTSSSKAKNYKVINDIKFEESNASTGNGFSAYKSDTISYIKLDGQGHTLTCGSDAVVFAYIKYSTISNLSVNDIQFSIIGEASYLTMNNVNAYGNVTWSGGNQGIFVIYADYTLTFNNCDNYATINASGDATSYNTIYVGYRYRALSSLTLNFTDCDNYGSLTSGKASMFAANLSQGKTTFNINNCNNYGSIRATYLGYTPNSFCSVAETNVYSIKVNGTEVELYSSFSTGFYHGPNDTIILTQNEDGTFTFTKSSNTSVAYYVVSVGLYVTWTSGESSGTNRFFVTERIESNGSESYTSTLKSLSFVDSTWVTNNSSATIGSLAGNTTYTLAGNTYYLVTGEGNTLNGEIKAAGMISVSAYDADGNLISSASL